MTHREARQTGHDLKCLMASLFVPCRGIPCIWQDIHAAIHRARFPDRSRRSSPRLLIGRDADAAPNRANMNVAVLGVP